MKTYKAAISNNADLGYNCLTLRLARFIIVFGKVITRGTDEYDCLGRIAEVAGLDASDAQEIPSNVCLRCSEERERHYRDLHSTAVSIKPIHRGSSARQIEEKINAGIHQHQSNSVAFRSPPTDWTPNDDDPRFCYLFSFYNVGQKLARCRMSTGGGGKCMDMQLRPRNQSAATSKCEVL